MTDQPEDWADEYGFAVRKVAHVSAWHYVARENLSAVINSDAAFLQAIARDVLEKEKGRVPSDVEVRRLSEELHRTLVSLYERIGMNRAGWPGKHSGAPDVVPEWVWRDSMLALDAHVADVLQDLGSRGEEQASTLRKNATARALDFRGVQLSLDLQGGKLPDVAAANCAVCEGSGRADDATTYPPKLFKIWAGSPPDVARLVGLSVWRCSVQPQLQLEKERSLPALSFQVDAEVARVMTTGGRVEQGVLVDRRGTPITEMVRSDDPLELPALDLVRAEALIQKGGERLGSLTSHRLMRWEVRTGHLQAMSRVADPRRISVVGGWEELARQIGAGAGHKAADDVRAILHAQAHLLFSIGTTGKKRGNLISYTFEEESRTRRAEVVIVLGDPLLPHFVVTEMRRSNSRKMREGRRLVPIVELPPFVGRPNEHGAQASLQARIVAEMRKRATELFENGGIKLEMENLARIAAAVELPIGLLPKVLDRWQRDGDDGPAFLEEVGTNTNRFTLARAHAPARDFLIQSGRNEVAGAKGGRRSVAVREKVYRPRTPRT